MKIKKININKIKRIKPGNIRITPLDNRFINDAPFVNSKSHLPKWFRVLSKGDGSLRSCSGISDFLEFGITIPAWATFTFSPNAELGFWEVRVNELSPRIEHEYVSMFPFRQTGSCPMTQIRKIEKMSYPKLINPWRIQTAPGWSSLMLPILFEENENYSVLPAIVNSDYYQAMNIVINPKTDKEFKILQGTPLVHLIPIERKNDISNIEFIDESFFKYASANMYMTGGTIPGASGKQGIAYKKAQKVVDGFLENKIPWYKKFYDNKKI